MGMYFSIPLGKHPSLLELQDYLRTLLPENAVFQEPGTFHISLVYMPDVMDAGDLSGIAPPAGLPVFGAMGLEVRTFDTPDGTAVTLEIQRVPQLQILQGVLAYEVLRRGIPISPFSYPGMYSPHVTLARLADPLDQYIAVQAVYLHVSEIELTAEDYQTVETYRLPMSYGNGEKISEMAIITDTMVVSEFSAGYPTVETFADVNVAELTAGDESPLYVVLPIGKDNSISQNNRFYSAAFVSELTRWVHEQRPVGNQGHIANEERANEYPIPKAYWVGTTKVGDTLWGKAYVPAGETRDMIRHMKAAKSAIATSIYGTGSMQWNGARGAWDVSPEDFKLESIDFAPPGRAGVPELARVPGIVTEMADNSEDIEMDKAQIIRELSAEDEVNLPDAVRAAVMAGSPAQKVLAEMQTLLGDDVVAEIKKLQAAVQDQRNRAIDQAVIEEIHKLVLPGAPESERIRHARTEIAEMVGRPESMEAVAGAVKALVEKEHIQARLKDIVVLEMGPNLKTGSAARKDGEKGHQYVVIPE